MTARRGQSPFDPRGELLRLDGTSVTDYIVGLLQSGQIKLGCEGGEPDLEYVTSRLGCSPFMYSSDFPHEVNNAYCRAEIDEILEHEALTPYDREAILHANAERFYGLA